MAGCACEKGWSPAFLYQSKGFIPKQDQVIFRVQLGLDWLQRLLCGRFFPPDHWPAPVLLLALRGQMRWPKRGSPVQPDWPQRERWRSGRKNILVACETLYLKRIPRWVPKKHCTLFAGLAFETNSWLDHKSDASSN